MRRSGLLGPLIFFGLPILEIVIIFWVASLIGWGWTLIILLAGIGLGFAMMRLAGLTAFKALTDPVQRAQAFSEIDPETGESVTIHPEHTMTPEKQQQAAAELRKSGLLFAGGGLLAIPGFLTDIAGLVLVLPPTRSLIGRAMKGRFQSQPGTVIAGETVIVDEEGVHTTQWGTPDQTNSPPPGPNQAIQGEILPPRESDDR